MISRNQNLSQCSLKGVVRLSFNLDLSNRLSSFRVIRRTNRIIFIDNPVNGKGRKILISRDRRCIIERLFNLHAGTANFILYRNRHIPVCKGNDSEVSAGLSAITYLNLIRSFVRVVYRQAVSICINLCYGVSSIRNITYLNLSHFHKSVIIVRNIRLSLNGQDRFRLILSTCAISSNISAIAILYQEMETALSFFCPVSHLYDSDGA